MGAESSGVQSACTPGVPKPVVSITCLVFDLPFRNCSCPSTGWSKVPTQQAGLQLAAHPQCLTFNGQPHYMQTICLNNQPRFCQICCTYTKWTISQSSLFQDWMLFRIGGCRCCLQIVPGGLILAPSHEASKQSAATQSAYKPSASGQGCVMACGAARTFAVYRCLAVP